MRHEKERQEIQSVRRDWMQSAAGEGIMQELPDRPHAQRYTGSCLFDRLEDVGSRSQF